MGSKVKPRHVAAARNHLVKDMFLIQGTKGGPMRDRRDRRPKNRKHTDDDYETDYEDVDFDFDDG